MRFISTRTHGFVDYAMGLLLMASPWLFGFSEDSSGALWTAVAIGFLLLIVSVMTDYELGVIRLIPMSTHLATDAVAGLVLVASPWVFGFADRVWAPHVVLGVLELGVALMTRKEAPTDLRRHTGTRAERA